MIQAYSRTNRVFGSNKEFGTIINFQYPRITEEIVNTALKLYGSGGKSSKAIVDTYDTAVKKFEVKINEMIPTLPNPTEWQSIENDAEKKEAFILAFKDAAEQLNLVVQYYEFKWNDITFGMNEHTWFQYVGAYRNLSSTQGGPTQPRPINTLVGKTKLAGTQVIDANHILNLVGSKVTTSNMGEYEQAKLLKEFVDTELVLGNLSSNINFDEAFENWKASKLQNAVGEFATEWGIDNKLLYKSVMSYSNAQPAIVPYINDLISSVDFSKATNQDSGNKLKHNMLLTATLPKWMAEIKQRYS